MKDYIMAGDAKILIDPEDHEKISQHSWHIQSGRNVVRCRRLGTSLQKFILGIKENDMTAYHLNGNQWNNRKSNLVKCTIGEARTYMKNFRMNMEAAYYANEYMFPKKKISFM